MPVKPFIHTCAAVFEVKSDSPPSLGGCPHDCQRFLSFSGLPPPFSSNFFIFLLLYLVSKVKVYFILFLLNLLDFCVP